MNKVFEDACEQFPPLKKYAFSFLPTFVKADDVAQWYATGTEKEMWKDSDFPNVAPPFERLWIEWHFPTTFNSEGTVVNYPDAAGVDAACLMAYFPFDEAVHVVKSEDQSVKLWAKSPPSTAKWVCFASIYVRQHRDVQDAGSMYFWIDAAGKKLHSVVTKTKDNSDASVNAVQVLMHVPLLSVSFMHCKNVRLVSASSNRKKPKPNANKEHCIRFKTLEIDPMKRILATQGRSAETGIQHALHICRGHFRNYEEGKGLFGKYHGTYWVPSHEKGNPDLGAVVKDYQPKPKE